MREVDCEQYTAEYWAAHRGKAGASDADSVITAAKGEYPAASQTLINQLIWDLLNPYYGMHEDTASRAMHAGLWMEPKARDFLEFELGCDIRQVGLCMTDDERFVCSPDGLIGDDGGIEFKCPDGKTHIKYLRSGVLPQEYRAQVHWSLIVTGRKYWNWVSWNPFVSPVVVRVEPDDFTEKLRANMERFWKEFVAARDAVFEKLPPPPPPKLIEVKGFGKVEYADYVSPF